MRLFRPYLAPSLALVAFGACHCDVDPLAAVVPRMAVTPEKAELSDVPDEQDTTIVFQVTALSSVANVEDLHFALADNAPPQFKLDDGGLTEVLSGQTGEVRVVVRPEVPSTIKTKLIVTAAPDTVPNRVEVPITITSIDAGLPEICGYPDAINFTPDGSSVGEGDVARVDIPLENCGTRDLLLDHIGFVDADQSPDCTSPDLAQLPDDCARDGALQPLHPPFACTAIPTTSHPASSGNNPEGAIHPGDHTSVNATFRPQDLDAHDAAFAICSNDPNHEPVVIPVHGQAEACPTACLQLVDGGDGIQPFDNVRLDGSCSTPADASGAITAYNWSVSQAPVGNVQDVVQGFDPSQGQLETDLPGHYCVNLDVVDTNGVRSCTPAQQCFDVVPLEDLHIQLVWDHPTADFDLHVLGDGGTPFTHETDCYFSNRHPTPQDCAPGASQCSWVDDVQQNPSLDHDDNNGYGPENTNITHPAPGSHWKIFVHYWDKKTPNSAEATATVRVFCFGQQVIEVSRHFQSDQQLWQALDLTWPTDPNETCSLSQIGVVQPFARPF